MGLLSLGTPLTWEEAKPHADLVRERGIEQLLNIWKKAKSKERDILLWGDEIEYLVVSYDEDSKDARLSLRQAEILKDLAHDEELRKAGGCVPSLQEISQKPGQRVPTFHAEYGRFMLEATPGAPYGGTLRDLLTVEPDMKKRRVIAKQHMTKNETPITMTSFPRLGVPGAFTQPYYPPHGPIARSIFVPDEIINQHIRFPTLTANIRSRRGSKVCINLPVFYDEKTPNPFKDPTVQYDLSDYPEDGDVRNGAAKDGHVYMDAMGFGMGSCCLQITFQAKNISEARTLYDQLCPLGPIMLALSAASPIFKGYLTDIDCRWNIISGAVDDRTEEERGLKPLNENKYVIPKSRYDSVSTYISQDPGYRPEYNDVDIHQNLPLKQKLLDGGMDELLAKHFAHLFIRDPLVIFSESINNYYVENNDNFENIQSTNWQHMRFKPPPSAEDAIGWRVEFRSMEVQLTDFENAAFSIFIVLLTRTILSYGLNFYIPISKVTENMETAHRRNAVLSEKFYFRKQVFPPRYANRSGKGSNASPGGSTSNTPKPVELGPVEDEYCLMTVNEIMNGQASHDGFPGLITLIESYLNSVNVDVETRCELARYLDLIRKRSNGTWETAATWIRNFVHSHPDYEKDSRVNATVNYDLVKAAETLGNGEGRGTNLWKGLFEKR
ncbi:Zn finger-containing GTPase- Activating Protein for ARF [Orbilia oligospora]|nr:Zn finger-containing GTPase- Activating Protein for ARF [Orbilia oligospora]KAF3168010.1 Zn finger-containing GTPase- Activating Protein for ARF [Orbilia oligospora]KAF3232490.1 Zn finger-containing GTPase- Activating Protein for ARF [Orbilia oligospora]KAF3238689.1 Zn finger-containing GTPase- Activating Protein for ARF [Orbilia oligospora]KAF3288968.1 Zn finger-containing GTPase- Activating Protein for ARF [Orbilia oligospora]